MNASNKCRDVTVGNETTCVHAALIIVAGKSQMIRLALTLCSAGRTGMSIIRHLMCQELATPTPAMFLSIPSKLLLMYILTLFSLCYLFDTTDQGNNIIRKEAQQVAHGLPSLRKGFLPHPKEDMLFMRIPS